MASRLRQIEAGLSEVGAARAVEEERAVAEAMVQEAEVEAGLEGVGLAAEGEEGVAAADSGAVDSAEVAVVARQAALSLRFSLSIMVSDHHHIR